MTPGFSTSKTYSYRARAFTSDNASAYTSEISATAASSSSEEEVVAEAVF